MNMKTNIKENINYKNAVDNEFRSAYVTQSAIRRWGNSQGIRLSKEMLSQMDLKENDTISISIYDGKMTIEKNNKPKYLNLKERLEAFYKRPIDEIYVENTQEVNVGDPLGNEIW
ncbi:MAG: AbrB/MazE/SpoVT family DNA-binding domain-containing protein [Firmicutes bacterium]|nr:AbrB/MazE/SpoVT family DNA-binding domain-containing protein [Bacillota bacterium]